MTPEIIRLRYEILPPGFHLYVPYAFTMSAMWATEPAFADPWLEAERVQVGWERFVRDMQEGE